MDHGSEKVYFISNVSRGCKDIYVCDYQRYQGRCSRREYGLMAEDSDPREAADIAEASTAQMQLASLVLPLCPTGRQTREQDYLLAHWPKYSQFLQAHSCLDSHGRPQWSSLCVRGRQRTQAWGSFILSYRTSGFWVQQDPEGLWKSPPFLTLSSFPIKLIHFIPNL